MQVLITGSGGLIGSEAVRHFCALGHNVIGIDNNMRKEFFGDSGDTTWRIGKLSQEFTAYRHLNADIRDREMILELFEGDKIDAVIHCAAQPSHDKAREIPFVDFEVNAVATLNLLEACRRYSRESPFIHMSTNKVYGDRPNSILLAESPTRWTIADPQFSGGIPESLPIDQSLHSLFGASKLAADVLVQEYGRYFGLPTVCLRGGCLTGPGHSGVQLHGFLSYLVKANVTRTPYTIFGYKGKQVRDNIHAHDVVRFMEMFIDNPKSSAVYNIGGGLDNSVSILEAFELAESITGEEMVWTYEEEPRRGDHKCYYSDLSLIRRDYPDWSITRNLDQIMSEIAAGWVNRAAR